MRPDSQVLLRRSWPRRLALWLGDDAPLSDRVLDAVSPLIDALTWIGCRVDGHAPFLEMDNRTTCCAYCMRVLDA